MGQSLSRPFRGRRVEPIWIGDLFDVPLHRHELIPPASTPRHLDPRDVGLKRAVANPNTIETK